VDEDIKYGCKEYKHPDYSNQPKRAPWQQTDFLAGWQ
jgi:hypothetical protein